MKKKKTIAEIKDLKVFLSQKNLFNKKKMNIKKVVISNANFSLLRDDLKLLNKTISKKFSNKKIRINNSNIFLKDNLEEVISIIKVNKTILFFDDEKLSNFFNLKGEIFNIPFTFDFNNHNDSVKYKKFNFNSKLLRLNISNKSTTEKKFIYGENNILFLNSTVNTKYNVKEKLITFKSDNSRLDNSQAKYTGELSLNPFDLSFNINLDDYKISQLFNINPILIEFIKSGLLFNDNISVSTSIIINSNFKKEIFQNAKIYFNIINGKINFNKTVFINNDIGSLQIINSNLFYKNNELSFNSDILIEIKNSKNLFSFLNTAKASRKDFKTILINLDYDFLNNTIKFNNLKIDNNDASDQFLTIIDEFNDNYFKVNRVVFLQDLINKLPKISLEMLAIISITGISVFFYNSELSTVAKISNLSFLTVVAIRLIPAFTGISVATISIKYVEPSIDIIVRDMKSSSYYSNLVNKKSESYTKKIKEIKLENLTFNYGLKNESLLENINLSIVENDKIGIHGTSGSGKTTLINLLTGLIPPTKGNVYFNEINIHNKTNIFYNKISYITQDTFLFDDTIENNIIFYGNKIDNEKLNKIIKICKLKNFIDNNPLGLQQNIGEKGLKISGGQKQRIGIARALYKDFDILILDEATSALNKDYERSIITSLNENFKDKIIIIISHDKENLLNCNKIINIENNKINIKDN